MRGAKIDALVQLNFGTEETAPPKNRAAWASRRISRIGRTVIPAKLMAEAAIVGSEIDAFVSRYNLNLDRFRFDDPTVKFPKNTSLVSHWGLRDTMTELNGTKDALPKQRAILDLMRRVVDGEIPRAVLDDPSVTWNIPKGTITVGGKTSKAKGHGALRWEHFRDMWKVQRKIDPYTPHGNVIDNKFNEEREIPEETIVGILTDIVSSPLAERVGRFVRDRLDRDLEPFDVYFTDFESGGTAKPKLAFDIRKKYPTAQALQDAIPDVLRKLGWKRDRAAWIASRIRVDNSRSAGHAWPPHTPSDIQLLRVRVDKTGCDEINFDTFMHELGHCVEGVVSSYEMDYRALWGVPNTAFSEGFAFTFQDRSDQILGRKRKPNRDHETLKRFWEPFEIAGAALTEIRFFHWLYKNPNATAIQMMKSIRRIGDEVWGEYYARIFGNNGHGLMSVYSHILWGDFYLADYPLGYVIAYQIRKHLEGKSLSNEVERICGIGDLYPEQWMRAAVGKPISVKPLLDDTRAALKRLGY
jgi:hypothetical protein